MTRRPLYIASLMLGAIVGWSLAAPMSSQVYPQVPIGGYIDPSVAASWNFFLSAQCTANANPDAVVPGFSQRNRTTFQAALNTAAGAAHPWIFIPRCTTDALTGLPCPPDDTGPSSCAYEIPKKSGVGVANIMGLDGTGLSNVNIISDGAVLREYYDASIGCTPAGTPCQDFWGLKIDNAAHWRIIGVTFSQRDITNPYEQDHWLQINTSGSTTVDDVLIQHCRFVDAPKHAGDMIRMLGQGLPPATAGYASRVNIIDNYFDHASRAGVSFQRGYFGVNVVENSFRATQSGTDVHNEPTSDGLLGPLLIMGNLLDRTGAGGGDSVTIPGNSDVAPATDQMVVANVFVNGYMSGGHNAHTWVSGNTSFWDSNVGAGDPSAQFGRDLRDFWFTNNWVYKGPTANENDLVQFLQEYNDCATGGPNCVLHDIWIHGNRLLQYASNGATGPTSPAIHVDTIEDLWITDNSITYGGQFDGLAIASSFRCIQPDCGYAGFGVNGYNSGWITGNTCRRGLQADGVTQAGRVYAAIVLGSTQTTCQYKHLTIRDNIADGVDKLVNGNGGQVKASNFLEGPPVIAENFLSTVPNFEVDSNAAALPWRGDTTDDSEQLAGAGAISPTKHSTTIAAAGTYTLAAAPSGGFVHHVTILPLFGAVAVQFSTFGDGSELDSVASTAGSFDVAYDAASSSWRLLNRRNVTVAP